MKKRPLSFILALSSSALAAALVLPTLAQESLLPEGFGNPSSAPTPAPTPTPRSTPTPGPTPSATPTPSPSGSASTMDPSVSSTSASDSEDEEVEDQEPGELKYNLPPGSRRLLTRIGSLTPETGGMAPDAFGVRGLYAAAIMRNTRGPLASRWGAILLRRALVSAVDTPATINGADLTAERAGLLLRMGESIAARWLVQAVDYDRASPRLVAMAQQVYLANADPAGLCPYVPAGLGQSKDESWRLAAAICSGLTGDAGPAGWAIGQVRSSGKISNFDILLAERVLGATSSGRRSTTIEWDGIDRLTSWRFGLATTTSITVPAQLRSAAPSYMRGWTVLAPMTDIADRLAAAPTAAARGILSSEAYLSLISAAESVEGTPDDVTAQAQTLRQAFSASAAAARYAAMESLWGEPTSDVGRYAAMVATARAAAALPVSTDVGDDPWQLLGSMLSAGYDNRAMEWASKVSRNSHAWGVLAVGSPRPLNGTTAASVESFSDNDDSSDYLRSKFLLAGLAGLDRLDAGQIATAAIDLKVDLTKETRWSRAILAAAERREPAMVALLAATGMQGGDWSKMPPYHLYNIVRALREVGLVPEARMIAAEALVRV